VKFKPAILLFMASFTLAGCGYSAGSRALSAAISPHKLNLGKPLVGG
jgi:hypothetical protein